MSPHLNSTLPASLARSNFYQMLDDIETKFSQFTISHRGKPHAVIMSADEFAGWQETMEILSDKKLLFSIKKALKTKKTLSSQKANKLIGW